MGNFFSFLALGVFGYLNKQEFRLLVLCNLMQRPTLGQRSRDARRRYDFTSPSMKQHKKYYTS